VLGEPPRPGPAIEWMDFAPNTNVIAHAGRTYAIVEAGARPYELTYELGTVGASDFQGTLPGGYTAHPKRDPVTANSMPSRTTGHGQPGAVQRRRRRREGAADRRHPSRRPVSIHDMSLTTSYAVIYDLPVVFSLEAAAAGSSFPYVGPKATRAGSACSRSRAAPRTSCGAMSTLVTSFIR